MTATENPQSNGCVERNSLFTVSDDIPLLGDMIAPLVKGVKAVPISRIADALGAAGLDPDEARAVLPRNAMLRAVNKLKKSRVIVKLGEDKDTLTFQFNRSETVDDTAGATGTGKIIIMDYETVLALDKDSGKVSCPKAGHDDLVKQAQEWVNTFLDTRDGGQISVIARRILGKSAGLFPMDDTGHAFFVPRKHKALEDQVAHFLGLVGAKLRQVPIPMGTPEGNQSVAEAVQKGFQERVKELNDATAALDLNSRKSTIKRQVQRLEQAKFQLEAYSVYLGDLQPAIAQALQQAQEACAQKVSSLDQECSEKKNQTGQEGAGSVAPGPTPQDEGDNTP